MALTLDGTAGITFNNSTTQAVAALPLTGGTLTGNLVIGSGANGITFPATQSASSDANTLDDYEEGTWTPSLGGTSSITSTATYTKIGNIVRATFDITVVSIGTGSQTIISGFPFSALGNDAGSISYFLSLSTSVYWLSMQMNGSGALLVGSTSSSTNIVNGINALGTGTRVIGTVVYRTST